MDSKFDIPPWAKILGALAALVVVVAGMKAASSILIPFFIAAFLSVIASGPLFWLQGKGIPGALAVVLVMLAIIGVGVGVGALVGTSLNDFTRALPDYQSQLEAKRDELISWLKSKGLAVPERPLATLINPTAVMGLTANVLRGVGGALTNTLLILLVTVFILLEASTFRGKLGAAFGGSWSSSEGFTQFSASVQRYIAIKTVASLLTGILVALWLLILGVDFPLLWGLSAFLLNYIPNLGSIIAAVPAILVALIQQGTFQAILVAVGYVVVNLAIGSFIEPRFMGIGLGLSPLVVFLSLVFWGWVFGPVGMLLSVLLTVTLKIALESNDDTRWVAVLMGPEQEAKHVAEGAVEEGSKAGHGAADPS